MKDWQKQIRYLAMQGIPTHAAGAGYFLVLSVFPMLLLLLGLMRYTGISVDTLTGALNGIVPQALIPAAKRLILSAYRNTSGTAVSLSALVALWSASRGVYGLIRGMNRVYHRQEHRSWFRVRALSMGYTFGLLLVVPAVLLVRVFGMGLVQQLPVLRFLLVLVVQTAVFAGLFAVLPAGGNRFWPSVPGALLASVGWLAFSRLYSWYVMDLGGYASVFGSVYAVALSMLWLYGCLCILFFGGVWNHQLDQKRK